ncbi:DUF2232 domain-containing protein [Desulfallas thermosapovorans]|uniref:Uncharacterized protein YybS (DUF2232 family) n=1 Tax=Desulfallas thermosapovorans DSM 6562 TaxID=1121431 RepID=A0A5S4ZW42_9FIRM|nr:DUF2232 domain-containing protein [Desulfallas thermosapovorans]TYO96436.1 uncharacterized protein YybS (DUF2232 family) [Desulfallas thermosapovorans DSM 6562]
MHPIKRYPGAIEIIIAGTVMSLLGLLGLYIAPLYFLTMLLLPMPLVYLILRRDLYHGLLAVILTMIMLFISFTSIRPVGLLVLQFAPLGILIGLMLKNKVTVDKSMAVLFFWALTIAGLNLMFSFFIGGAGISQVTDEFRATMEQTSQLYSQNGLIDEADKEQYLALTRQMIELVQTFLPGSVAVWNIMMTMFTYFIARHLMRSLGLCESTNYYFTQWRLPWYSIWLIITGLALTLGGDELSWQLMEVTGKNILYIAAFIFFVLGMAVIAHYIQIWGVSKIVKFIVLFAMLLYLPFTAMMVLTIGVIDPLINFRRLPNNDDNKNKGG